MKNLFVVLFLLISFNVFSQSSADSCDYFRVGLYGGSYINGHEGLVEKNKLFNSIALEAEYVKLKNLAFYIRCIYEFTKTNYGYDDYYIYLNKPMTYRFAISFGGRYYLRERNIRPYFQVGFNHETNYRGSYSYYHEEPGNYFFYSNPEYWSYYYALNIGVGLDIKIYKNLSADIKYDLYKIYKGRNSEFDTFSVLAGVKYNLIF